MKETTLTRKDFDTFAIEGFAPRMEVIKNTLRPKLVSIAERLAPAVSELVGAPMFVHVAKHARRTVNPPPETWAAFAHEARGYKKLPHFALAVSTQGIHARLVLKDEALDARARLSKSLVKKAAALAPTLSAAHARTYTHWGCETLPDELDATPEGLRAMARKAALKTGVFDLGIFLGKWQGDDAVLDGFRALLPVYSLAVAKK
jgi:uncharacterized protein YktB (UPF0637 family)